jgi:hypothetical protein
VHSGLEIQSSHEQTISLVKFQWTYYSPKDAKWEHKETMREAYPQIFANFEENLMKICT